jgi:predicted AAA+ superfamily ATPase
MLKISEQDIVSRLKLDNPWWSDAQAILEGGLPKRDYFARFYKLVEDTSIRRATVLMGPRRVGKTIMIRQAILELITNNIVPALHTLYVSLDTPVYVGLNLEQIINLFLQENKLDHKSKLFIFFDEIQYLKNWEVHLKDAVDRYSNIKFIASGSAAAALRLKSNESGAGRFTDFMLPPLTFSEYIHFSGKDSLIIKDAVNPKNDKTTDVSKLNEAFIDYINFGGYPEVVMNPDVKDNTKRFVKQDIIDKVLLHDLPSLYGITDISELKKLFAVLAYNTGNEVSLENLSKESTVPKEKLGKYLEYLEAAFLIVRVTKVDDTAKHFKRQRNFKVYLTNPSMRAALFSPIKDGDQAIGSLTETAIFCQWFHSPEIDNIHYAHWKTGEVDLVKLDSRMKPIWAYEIKWSDRYYNSPNELKPLIKFSKDNELDSVGCSTKTEEGKKDVDGVEITFFPSSLHCYQVGRRVTLGSP